MTEQEFVGQEIVVTGAGSYLGSRAVEALVEGRADRRVWALLSPRGTMDCSLERAAYRKVDLESPLPDEIKGALARAERVFHFAWIRGPKLEGVNAANRAMLDRLLEPMPDPSRLIFVSSVAGCPGALSTYGRAKAEATRFVEEKGGAALLCGLVVDRIPRGPYKMLTSVIEKLPVRLRLGRKASRVFPVHIDDVARCAEFLCGVRLERGTYRLYAEGMGFDRFMALLETLHPKVRLPLPMSAPFILTATRAMKAAGLAPWRLSDKVLTFLYKDDEYLEACRPIPGFTARPISAELLRG